MICIRRPCAVINFISNCHISSYTGFYENSSWERLYIGVRICWCSSEICLFAICRFHFILITIRIVYICPDIFCFFQRIPIILHSNPAYFNRNRFHLNTTALVTGYCAAGHIFHSSYWKSGRCRCSNTGNRCRICCWCTNLCPIVVNIPINHIRSCSCRCIPWHGNWIHTCCRLCQAGNLRRFCRYDSRLRNTDHHMSSRVVTTFVCHDTCIIAGTLC